jgi:disulfide bond formation protein DsbB
MTITPRIYFLFGLMSCIIMTGVAAYFQLVEELEPCPLCISQRIMLVLVAVVMLLAVIHNPGRLGVRVYSVLATIAALLGAGVSARHIWLQHLPPDEVPECGPGLQYIFENFPLAETFKLMLNGTGECAEVLWTFMGLSIPGWTLVAFLVLTIVSLSQFWNIKDKEN